MMSYVQQIINIIQLFCYRLNPLTNIASTTFYCQYMVHHFIVSQSTKHGCHRTQ